MASVLLIQFLSGIKKLKFYLLFAIRIANIIRCLIRYSNYRKNANKRKFQIPTELPLSIKRTSYPIPFDGQLGFPGTPPSSNSKAEIWDPGS